MKKIGLRKLSAIAAVALSASVLSVAPAQADTTIKIITPNYTDAMPAYYADLNARFEAANPGIKWVLVDKYQDTNPMQEEIYLFQAKI